ncbi:hypothetical protein GGR54DRAFT_607207 [Hypoxylon sp. NC1633]|nr:hypothetical protein GGR54DRAFT_607207 [Hypoxylon sp. NC1633]
MDSSAPKRRKTSPTTNVPVGGSSAPPPSDESNRRSSRLRMPSFASPTRASLARSNPDILARMDASRAQPSNDAPAASEPGDVSEESDVGSRRKSGAGQIEDSVETGNRDAQQAVSTSADRLTSPVRRVTGAMASRPRRTPNKPSPRPLPPPSTEEEELINPFRGRVLRRSPPPGAPIPEEPELPPTPTEKGISDPASVHSSPAGIHNTPTKRPRRSRALAEAIKSSPLKQPPIFPPDLAREYIREESPSQTVERTLRAQPQSRKRKRKSQSGRNVEEPDPLAGKKALRDSLLSEIALLKSDLGVATRENDRLHQLQQAKRDSPVADVPEDEDGLLDLLRRHTLPPEKEVASDPTEDWLEAALNPISLLPFSKPNPSLSSLFFPQQEKAEESEKPPISHHPVSMTAGEELPYLQVFTPLTFTSTITIIPRDNPVHRGPLMQKHVISASSTPPGLFATKIEMTVNTKTLAVTELSVPRLEPSAVNELGPFVQSIVQGTGSSSLTRNVSVLTWAMGEWLCVATRRARFWCAIEKDLGSIEGLAECAKQMRIGTRRKRGGRGRPAAAATEDSEEDNDGDGDDGRADKLRFTKATLLPQLGRSSFDLQLYGDDPGDKTPSLRVQWRIEFDWTGEAQSKMGLLVKAPAKWHGRDTRGSLTNIPDVFDKLVRDEGDPMVALRTVVALLVGEG